MVSEAQRAAASCAAAPVWAVSDTDLVACLEQAWAGAQQLTTTVAHLIRQAEARGLPAAEAASSTVVWLRQRLRMSPAAAHRLVALAKGLDARPTVDAAVSAGVISTEQAATIIATVTDLPPSTPADVVGHAETVLVDMAGQFDPVELSRLGTRILDHVAPGVAERREEEWLARQEARAHRKRAFTLSPVGASLVRVSGWLDAAGAATVTAALDPLCHPRHDPAGTRSPAQRRADALVDVCGAASRASGASGDANQVVVTVPLDVLAGAPTGSGRGSNAGPASDAGLGRDAGDVLGPRHPTGSAGLYGPGRSGRPTPSAGPARAGSARPAAGRPGATRPGDAGRAPGARGRGAARLDTGAVISATQARLMACDARVLPAVLGGDGQVLDLGRSRRLFTGPIRRALILRDRGCAFPGCDRPPRWTEAHHLVGWAEGGETSLANACLVCRYHHRVLHNGGWQARLGADGRPEFVPPAILDPQRRPRRNTYHQRE
jgi:hypothetical protein